VRSAKEMPAIAVALKLDAHRLGRERLGHGVGAEELPQGAVDVGVGLGSAWRGGPANSEAMAANDLGLSSPTMHTIQCP
jgi:hypothetical protein